MPKRKDPADIRLNNIELLISRAANSGDLETLKSVLSTVPENEVKKCINYPDKLGITPLISAIRKGKLDCVKLLLYHGADINYTIRHKIHQNSKVWHFAKRAGFSELEQYLRKCHSDYEKLGTTRAQLELSVEEIATNPYSSLADRERFDVCLRQLIKHCEYNLGAPGDDTETNKPLLIKAAHADNIPIILKLINDFKVNETTHDFTTAETIMHIACQNKSKLRFYLVKHFPSLLRKPDCNGNLPLHIACKKNDIEFVSWLFGNILSAEGDEMDDSDLDNGIRKARSFSDVLSPISQIPPNRSFQNAFPMSPVELTSTKSQFSHPNELGRESNEYDKETAYLREQGLLVSYESARCFTVSVTSGSSRSGSSERSLSKSKSVNSPMRNSTSTEEDVDVEVDSSEGNEFSSGASNFIFRVADADDDSPPLQPSIPIVSNQGSKMQDILSGPSMPLTEPEVNTLLDLENLVSLHPLTISNIVDMKPFSVAVNGDSIFHIMARDGYSEMLAIIVKVANFLKHRIDLTILVSRQGFSSRLPIEEAIYIRSPECVKMLINLSMAAGLMPELLQDPHILRCAVITSDVKLVRILISNGFHKGLKPAISLAIISEFDDILRVLLYWQTQVVNSLEYARSKTSNGIRMMSLDRGLVKWEGVQLDGVHRQWLADSFNAVNSVSKCLRLSSISTDITEHNFKYFKKIGTDCLQYFDNFSISPKLTNEKEIALAPITEVNISENQIESVPCELFQMASLRTLRLSHNKLQELPSSTNLSDNLYTSKIVKLHLDWNMLTELPEQLFRGFASSLEELNAQSNHLKLLPPGLWVMPKLKVIRLCHNQLRYLHTLSNPSFFNDCDLSKVIASTFTTNDEGQLICTATNPEMVDMQYIFTYLTRLALFYQTVCVARCPKGFCTSISDIYQEMITVHLTRHLNFARKGEDWSSGQETPTSSQVLSLVEDEEFESVTKCTMNLDLLDLSYNEFAEMPWDLACISPDLKKLDLRGNKICQLDIIHSVPRGMDSLILLNNTITALNKERSVNLPCGNPLRLLCVQIDERDDRYCQHCNHPTLETLSNLCLEDNNLSHFPIVDNPRVQPSDLTSMAPGFDIVHCDTYYPLLSILSLARNRFQQVPKFLYRLTKLSSLNLSFNNIVELPLEMGLMNISNLLLLKLDGMYIRNIPETLVKQHTPKQLLNHLKALKQKSRPYRRMKLMVVGEANMGKTSLLLNLAKKGRVKRFTEVEMSVSDLPLATTGVELGDWEYSHGGKPKITFMTWDFGGQEEYYATHQCFLTRRSLYLLLWNVKHGEEGLKSLKPWLEKIEGRAPKSPVIVIATHLDHLPQNKRHEITSDLQNKFRRMYIVNSHRKYTYPRICDEIQFISVNSSRHVDALRDYIYEFAIQYKVQGPTACADDVKPLLDEPIPESYIILQDFVREVAQQYMNHGMKPILTKKQFIQTIQGSEYSTRIKEADIDQAVSFLHDSGILLHFADSSQLNDLYFINPQWLCSMLAKLITVREHNPFQKQGFMLMQDVRKIYADCFREFIELMQRFDVVFLLDEQRLLIPSLLPMGEEDACLVFARSLSESFSILTIPDQLRHEPHAPMYETPHPVFTRYYLLPFIPNGFFTRLMARLMSSGIIDHMQQSLINNKLGMDHVINSAHWKCWRNGIMITWSHMEIFRIAPICGSLAGVDKVAIITKENTYEYINEMRGLEIKVAMLPKEYIEKCSTLECQLSASSSLMDGLEYSSGRCLATWLLHQATTYIDSVFEDWYESFARRKGFDPHQENVRITNPCNKCAEHVQNSLLKESRRFNHRASSSVTKITNEKICYIFTGPYAALISANNPGEGLFCPEHGHLKMADVAPDLVFCDFLPGTVFTNPNSLTFRQQLGDGGFGAVFRTTLHTAGTVQTIAAKKFTPDLGFMDQDEDIVAQLKAWDIYQKASTEARVMHQLSHENILGLIGIALRPLSLLVELAPEGDLRTCVERFKKESVRLSRRTMTCTLIQVAEALNYLHSRQFIYRDLKPENVLVWKFPRPETQWSPNASVYIKVADYGISTQITPQGIRGIQGTRPYLPPEMILCGGREPYSTKVDVYAFGMFIYYLTSFRTPFDNIGRPITSVLDEGKRPELSLKLRPHSLHMFELMCWCWSEKPTQRPNFPTILEILKQDDFTQLLASFPLIGNEEVITTSCVRLYRRRLSNPNLLSHSMMVDQSLASVGVMNLVYGNSSVSGNEEFTTQVWYGTEFGKIGVFQFQRNGFTNDTFELPQGRSKYISEIKLISGRIWLATVGLGLLIYNPTNRQQIGHWGLDERLQIYTLMEIESSKRVLVLTHRGMFVFNSDTTFLIMHPTTNNDLNDSHDDNDEGFTPLMNFPNDGEELNIGVVIPKIGYRAEPEIWATSLVGEDMTILNTSDFSIMRKVPIRKCDKEYGRKMRHMVTLEVANRPFVAVANKHLIHLFDVEERVCTPNYFNCQDYTTNPDGLFHTQSGRVTALLAKDHFLYAAIGGGAILYLNCRTMEPIHIFDAYLKPARSLLLINYSGYQSKPFHRLLSHDTIGSRNNTLKSSGSSTSSLESMKSSYSGPRRSSLNTGTSNDTSHSVLVSFGGGYKGVVRNCQDCPENFLLPSEGNKTNTQQSKPNRSIVNLLLWSTEVKEECCLETCEPDRPVFDENDELDLIDDSFVVTSCD